ncbi:hypothetical protein BCEP4_1350056 [Burkholderia cepacia]|nr:hypothetical protein BCEP4_1350056 [Burkholderia cepacia]
MMFSSKQGKGAAMDATSVQSAGAALTRP